MVRKHARSGFDRHISQTARIKETARHLGVRSATHKLIYYWKKDAWELFDLTKDPNEQKNIYDDPASKLIVEDLKAEIKRLQAQFKDEDQFANNFPNDGVDAPKNVPRNGLKTVSEAIQASVVK